MKITHHKLKTIKITKIEKFYFSIKNKSKFFHSFSVDCFCLLSAEIILTEVKSTKEKSNTCKIHNIWMEFGNKCLTILKWQKIVNTHIYTWTYVSIYIHIRHIFVYRLRHYFKLLFKRLCSSIIWGCKCVSLFKNVKLRTGIRKKKDRKK